MAALRFEAVGRTHAGSVRRRNEDAFFVGESLFVVADGLGGHVAGDVASRTAVEAMRSHDGPGADLGAAIRAAGEALRRRVRAEPELAGMGTTVVALLASDEAAVLANVGDSRAYLLRDDRMSRLTEDHLYRNLVARAEVVPGFPERLTRFLDGRNDGRSADLTPVDLRPGDRVLLCSDGLSSYVSAATIETALRTNDPTAAAAELIAAALTAGGHDNVTVVVIDAG